MKHQMKLQKKYFDLIKSGDKSIELRLFDEKRKSVSKGDIICFYFNEEMIETTVTEIITASDFKALSDKINPVLVGFKNVPEMLEALELFYPKAEQNKSGVVAFKIKL